jgi:hypothetical protein
MMRFPRIPFPVVLTGAVVGMALYACGSDGPGFGGGGNSHDETWIPGKDDTATGDTGGDDSALEDSVVVDETAVEDTYIEDTSPPYDGEGYDRGDVAYNLKALDHTGSEWSLYHHGGSPVVLVFGYAQSFTFQEICGFLPSLAEEYGSHGLTTAVLLFGDDSGSEVDQADADAWAQTYGLDTVLFDDEGEIAGTWANTTEVKTFLIDGDMVIDWTNSESTSEEQLSQKIGDLVY